MEALKVECMVANAWSPPAFGVHLDGLIAWALVYQAKRSSDSALDFDHILSDLPLDKHEFPNGTWAWKASMMVPTGVYGLERRMLTGKTSPHDMFRLVELGVLSEKGGRWEGAKGPEKNSQVFYTTQRITGLQSWCVGNADAISELLDEVRAVGTRTRIGMGALLPFDDGKFWRVTSCEKAEKLWSLRNLPSLNGVPDMPRYRDVGSYQPPYWGYQSEIYRPILNDYITHQGDTDFSEESPDGFLLTDATEINP